MGGRNSESTPAQKCLSNANDLIADAILLKESKRKERAYTLFQLATEEVGKAIKILLFIIFDRFSDQKETKKFIDDFRDHKKKTKQSIALDYFIVLIGEKVITNKLKFIQASLYEFDNVEELNNLKNYSLYTSYYKGNFKTPKEIITNSDLDSVEFRTITRYKVAKAIIEFQLTYLEEIKNYISTNHITLSEKEYAEKFREELGK